MTVTMFVAKPYRVLFIFFKLVNTFFNYFKQNNTPPTFPLELKNRYKHIIKTSYGNRPQTKKRVLTIQYIYKKLSDKEDISYGI